MHLSDAIYGEQFVVYHGSCGFSLTTFFFLVFLGFVAHYTRVFFSGEDGKLSVSLVCSDRLT